MERYKSVDQKVQTFLSGMHRKISRRNFVYKVAMGVTAAIATLLIRPIGGLERAFAHGPACNPPHGQYCSGCGADSCPSGYTTCTTSSRYSDCPSWCPYSSGWWFSEGANGGHKCRDCYLSYVTSASRCNAGYRSGGLLTLCGCRSTAHFT
ncbi:hypothetical protein [Bacillus sp. V3-13]|uniref:hypothetical protein n=1 Tax=Bacillus sp. V3-13 TaxID=2053728 RepID=UPI00115B1064|nr:hypothetical protein [Bacillus sp. V3-13]